MAVSETSAVTDGGSSCSSSCFAAMVDGAMASAVEAMAIFIRG